MSDASETGDAQFVGEGRRALVAGLVAAFDQTSRDSRPVWVSLEAPTGWGKTRIGREFYAALAKTHQTEPAYWPTAIVSDRSRVSERRKTVNPPDFEHVPMSRPDYLWWGISCEMRNGTPTESLLHDIAVLRKHIDHLENAWWYRAGFLQKFAYPAFFALRAKVLEEGASAIVDYGVTKASELVGGALPGFSAMSWLVRKGVEGGKAARARRQSLRSTDDIVYRPSEVDEVESFLTKIAPLVPVVLFVEDVHDADDLLLELLERMTRRDAPVLILTTGWPGVIEANAGLTRDMRKAGDRLIRIDENTSALPPPFSPEASLTALSSEELSSIIASHVTKVDPSTRSALLSAYPNPFALELVLETYGDSEGDVLAIAPADVARLAVKVEDLYKAAWDRLDDRSRERLTFATLAIPAVVSGRPTESRSWDRVMLEAALSHLDDHDAPEGSSVVERAWVRPVDAFLSQFHDVAQLNVASKEFAKAQRRLRVRDALVDEAKHLIADEATPADRSAQASRLLLAYGSELDPRDFIDATRALTDVLGGLHAETKAIALVGEDAHSRLDLSNERDRDLLRTLAQAHGDLRNPGRAKELLEELVTVQSGLYGSDSSEVLETRRSIARAVASDGRPQVAVGLLEQVLAQQLRTRAASDAEVLDTRAQLSRALADADRHSEAVELDRELLAAQASTFGDDSLELLSTRQRLATALTDSGRAGEARPVWHEVATELTERFGRDDPATLAARSRLARATEDAVGADDAVGLYAALLADERRVLGPDHRNVLMTRGDLARSTNASGDLTQAEALYRELTADEARILDPGERGAATSRSPGTHIASSTSLG